ncbi:cenp-O kinetochore centromere component [Pseudomassariella vexata]|uniref:Cenp-O kinetochore centromere component n=1 Tax=Pseudomassariella vexata TaxID=1141098 RepID=A0A1Y2E7G3_9PEZI|nr:cenp-O kinetochore centromere component [Pseudomassariella vexata]ORY67377.1 cenp-O kinetochore centromere component [Pseudomassariella vexata]
MSSRTSQSPDLSVADKLDNEIAILRSQVGSLKRELKLQATTLLTADSTREIIRQGPDDDSKARIMAQSDQQIAHKQQCLYRACASVTALKIRDPDPNAVDEGNVLGLRFEVMSKSRFIRPYYVMLNRPYPDSRRLRIHRHTVPPSIPLAGLAARHLPAPRSGNDDHNAPQEQDLSRFARALRRELVRYQNRVGVIGDLRNSAGLESKKGKRKEVEFPIVDISAADAEIKQIRIQWADEKTGRLVMDDDGHILKMVVQGENGRDRETVRDLLGGSVRIEELTKRMSGD